MNKIFIDVEVDCRERPRRLSGGGTNLLVRILFTRITTHSLFGKINKAAELPAPALGKTIYIFLFKSIVLGAIVSFFLS